MHDTCLFWVVWACVCVQCIHRTCEMYFLYGMLACILFYHFNDRIYVRGDVIPPCKRDRAFIKLHHIQRREEKNSNNNNHQNKRSGIVAFFFRELTQISRVDSQFCDVKWWYDYLYVWTYETMYVTLKLLARITGFPPVFFTVTLNPVSLFSVVFSPRYSRVTANK